MRAVFLSCIVERWIRDLLLKTLFLDLEAIPCLKLDVIQSFSRIFFELGIKWIDAAASLLIVKWWAVDVTIFEPPSWAIKIFQIFVWHLRADIPRALFHPECLPHRRLLIIKLMIYNLLPVLYVTFLIVILIDLWYGIPGRGKRMNFIDNWHLNRELLLLVISCRWVVEMRDQHNLFAFYHHQI